MIFSGQLKCHRCPECNGQGCSNMLPGLGGVMDGYNFQANYKAWKEIFQENREKIESIEITPAEIRCGPVTGAQENIGFSNEKDFYFPY